MKFEIERKIKIEFSDTEINRIRELLFELRKNPTISKQIKFDKQEILDELLDTFDQIK